MNLKDRLAERGIVCAHIIDDAFDSVPTYALTAEAAQHVLEVVEDTDLKIISDILGLPTIGEDKKVDEDKVRTSLQTVEEIQKLFRRKVEIPENAAKTLFDPFDKDMEGKRSQLTPLSDLLTANGVACHCFGADYNAQDTAEPQLFFVDLKLKEGTVDVLRHEDAVRAYTSLKTVHPGCKPFVFLMSSLTLQLGAKRELFRRDADLFQSEFEDIDKAAFTNGDELSRVLASYTKAMPQLATLRNKMNDVQLAVASATDSVMRELRALDLADYFVLYHNTTSVEKVNLGSYVVEMLLEFLAHEVEGRDQIWDLASALDSLNVQELPRARFGLTPAAAQLYSANMLHSQAMLLAEDKMERGPSNGYFFTGDIFFDAQSLNLPVPTKALAIVTPACDMARLEQLKGRSILLCEGSVREMEPGTTLIAKDSLPLVVMRHPRVHERYVVIEWHRKKLHVWDDKDRAKFANPEECSFVRTGRLRPVYALQLQDAVTSDLSRVGTQKPPSALVPHGMRCLVSDGKKWHEIYADANLDAAALSDLEGGKKKLTTYILSDPAMHKALVRLAAWLSANPTVTMKASFEKVLGDEARAVLRGFSQKLSEKAQDVTMYPFDGKWTNNDGKFVGVVRGVDCQSPYAQVADGQDFRNELQARVIFRLEKQATSNDEDIETGATTTA
ncbi:MAG: hypothetical protein OEL86_04535 [Sulfuritalea sp.]|nr:hypothetical protein [Sulfuritalea sp.]